ncbi:hypothetical protein Tco_1017289 [Tanacetum coccineum]|uniref:Uncharacterized protein n=1 Tax=Tanacetum coccineum TaxID=301880 RepID=A0ABQ5FS52_9ASTR
MDRGGSHPKIPVEKIYMASYVHEEEYFNPLEIKNDVFSYESPECLLFEQHTQSCDNESIDTLGLSQELKGSHKNEERGPSLEKIVSRWHVCKPVRVFYDEEGGKDCGMWPTYHERQSVGGNRIVFANFLKVIYGNKVIEDTTRERRYYEWVAQNSELNDNGIAQEATVDNNPCKYHHEYPHSYFPQESLPKPKDTIFDKRHSNIKTYFPNFPQTQVRKPQPRDYSFKEWLKIKLGHTNVSKLIGNEVFNEWLKDSFDVEIDYGKPLDDPYSRRFDEYKEKFDSEIEQLAIEYDLRVGMKKYALDDIWEKCDRFQDTACHWHDEGFEEDEQWESGIEKTCYTPPFVKSENFEVKRYSFKNEKSFVRETSLLYRRVARFHLLQLSFEEESNAQGSLLF